jgi:hypothetical protein
MKFRRNLTNTGIICGFAIVDTDGRLHVHQNAFAESGLILDLPDSVRPPAYPFELVTVLYQIIPTASDDAPIARATWISPMAAHMLPKRANWKARDFICNLDFYPFGDRYGIVNDQIMAGLPILPHYPEWVYAEAETDSSFEEMLFERSGQALQNRALVTCYLRNTGRRTIEGVLEHPSRMIAEAMIPHAEGTENFLVEISHGCRGYMTVNHTKPNGPGIACTLQLKHDFEHKVDDDGNLVSFHSFWRVIEILTVSEADQLHPNGAIRST